MINKRLDAAKSVSVNLVISCSSKVAAWQPALDLDDGVSLKVQQGEFLKQSLLTVSLANKK